jgi:hypothetical protein
MLYLVILAPAALVAFVILVTFVALPPADGVAGGGVEGACAFAAFTVYRATVANAANNTTAVITNDICLFIKTLITKYQNTIYMSFLIHSSIDPMGTEITLVCHTLET